MYNQINHTIEMCCNNGRIEIIMGSMFSGKSTEIIRIINRYRVLDKSILIINSAKDNRYGENSIITHNKQKKKCLSNTILLIALSLSIIVGLVSRISKTRSRCI